MSQSHGEADHPKRVLVQVPLSEPEKRALELRAFREQQRRKRRRFGMSNLLREKLYEDKEFAALVRQYEGRE